MANIPDPEVGNGHEQKSAAPRRSGFLRWVTGIVLLAVGAFLLIASRDKIGDWNLDKNMATYAGVVMMAFGVTLILTHFEAPDATLTGQLPWFGDKVGVYAQGYVLVFALLLVCGVVSVFMLNNVTDEREDLNAKLKSLTDLVGRSDGEGLLPAFRKRLKDESALQSVLTAYMNNSSFPMRVMLKCPDQEATGNPLFLDILPIGDPDTTSQYALIRNTTQRLAPAGHKGDLFTIRGQSVNEVSVYSDVQTKDSDLIFALTIEQRADGSINTLINLRQPAQLGKLCPEQASAGEGNSLDEGSEPPGQIKRAIDRQPCVKISGPNGPVTCG